MKVGMPGMMPVLTAITAFKVPSPPAAGQTRLALIMTNPMTRGLLAALLGVKTMPTADTSTRSPASVPVPWRFR